MTGPHIWVESSGGPLIVLPVTALADWHGCFGSGTGDDDPDYVRAWAVDGWAGAITVGRDGARGLAFSYPANTCWVPEISAFVLWMGADDGESLVAAARAVIADPATVWDDCGTWETDGPAILMDSVEEGAGPEGNTAPMLLTAGERRVRAAHAERPGTVVTVVRLLND